MFSTRCPPTVRRRQATTLAVLIVSAGCCLVSAEAQTTAPAPTTQPAINGVYVLGLEGRSDTGLAPYLADPAVDGFSLRAGWADAEPRPGEYDWSLFDPVIAAATAQHKKIMLRVLAGVKTPGWVYEAGAVRFSFTDTNRFHKTHGETLAMPVPWDPVYLERWTKFVAAFGARYANNPAVTIVAITGPAAGGEMHLVSKDNRDAWHKVGYSNATLVAAWRKTIDAFVAAFPHRHLTVAIAHPVAFDNPADVVEQVVAYCAERGCGIQGNWLAAKTPPSHRLYQRIAEYAAHHPVGFQMLSSAGVGRFGGTLAQALDHARDAHARFVEIYLPDVTAFPADVARAHEELLKQE